MQTEQTPVPAAGAEQAAGSPAGTSAGTPAGTSAGTPAGTSAGTPPAAKKHHGFTGKIGFVLAAAGSAVGLGNLWRFPYLAAKYGGGIFILCYIILAATVGITLLMLEIAIGRKTGKGVLGAFASLNKKFKWLGFICLAVPIIIVPYYCVIGGWVVKYIVAFFAGSAGLVEGGGAAVDTSAYFSNFISDPWQPLVFFLIFAAATVLVVVFGVQKGIERISKVLMPLLAVISIGLMIYVLCQEGALEGVAYLFTPDFSKFSYETLLAALGQLFYSLSLAMGIMITYGSYMKKEVSVPKSSLQIAICDSAFAIVAATIIIPSVFVAASGNSDAAREALGVSGPSLMFEQLPAVFNKLGGVGRWIGAAFFILVFFAALTSFFILVFFAALTSSISLVEAIVAVLRENLHLKRWVACTVVLGIVIVLGTISSLGFGVLSGAQITLPSGSSYTILDMFDYLANSILMPIVAILTCILAGYFIDKNLIPDEIGLRRKASRGYFRIMVRYIAPVCMAVILISGIVFNLVLPPL